MKKLLESLQLTFGNCKRIDTSACLTKSSFEFISKRIFYLYDDRTNELPVRIVDKVADYQLTVSNRNKYDNDICIVKTDKCLFTDRQKKCDCILFNKDKLFFVEISEAGSGNRSNKRRDAVEQLGDTIKVLKANNIDFSTHDTKAIICFKNGSIRPTQPSLNTMRAIFTELHNVSLEEGNAIEF